jgi:iron complex transport system ATP-binding protein
LGIGMGKSIIDISRFSFSIGGKDILRDVSFGVAEGDYISIVGPNGAGKTTLLRCISRIHKGGRGDIRIAGRPLHRYSQRELALQVSYVPQADGRNSPFTVYEFVMMGRYAYLSPFSSFSTADRDAVRDALAITGISDFEDRYLRTLSGGERQKIFIAAALAQQAKVLLLDEPTTFLDPKHEAEIYGLLARVNRERRATIISVTHDINSAVLTSRTVMALKEGTVAFCGPAEEFMKNDILERVYEKSFALVKHPLHGKTIVAPEAPL